KITAQRKSRQQFGILLPHLLQTLRRVVAKRFRNHMIRANLAGLLCLCQQLLLEAAVADLQHGGDTLSIGFAAQVRNTVLGDVDITQVSRNRGVTIIPDDIRRCLATALAPGAQQQDGARVVQLVPLDYKVVLAAHTAEHLATFQLVGNARAHQGGRENRIDETCIASLQALQAFVTVQLVDETDIRHTDAGAFFRAHVFQATIERLRTEEKATVQQGGAQAVGKQRTDGFACRTVLKIIYYRVAIRQQQAFILELYRLAQDALLLQPAQHALVQG